MSGDEGVTRLDDRQRLALARFLLRFDTSGLAAAVRDRALAAVLGPEGAPLSYEELVGWLEACGPDTAPAVQRVRGLEREALTRAHALLAAGLPLDTGLATALRHLPLDAPPGWETDGADRRLGEAVILLGDRLYLEQWEGRVPVIAARVAGAFDSALRQIEAAALDAAPTLVDRLLADGTVDPALRDALVVFRNAWTDVAMRERGALATALGEGRLPPRSALAAAVVAERLHAASDVAERRRLLDWLLVSPTRDVVRPLLAACDQPWAQQRAVAVLSLRFGTQVGSSWTQWAKWLEAHALPRLLDRALSAGVSPALLLLLYVERERSEPAALLEALRASCRERAEPVVAEHFLERWGEQVPLDETAVIAGRPSLPESAPAAAAEPAVEPPATPETRHTASVPAAPPLEAPPAESVPAAPQVETPAPEPTPPRARVVPDRWREFVTENANLLAGVAMLLVGASLVAYFTWDRHWLFRYTIVPGLFAAFTAGLAGVARWLERTAASERGTAAMLRGAAIALLPANCMSVTLLASDPLVTRKIVAVPAMAALYVVLVMLGLRRWCGAVHPKLRGVLAPGLVFLNALVLVPPLARGLALDPPAVLAVLTGGFYLGFLVVAGVSGWFATRVLDREVAAAPHVSWFAGSVLVLTYVQVFAWTYAWERQWPPAFVYGPLVILAGGLVFFLERRFRLVVDSGEQGEESFVGFALILAGLLVSFGHPVLRVVAFALAGPTWLYQAGFRRNRVHDYLGLLLLVLGGASVSLVDGFPLPAVGGLGLGIFGVVAGLGWLAPRIDLGRLRGAAVELGLPLLALTAVVAALAQWHYRSEPLATAAILAATAVLLFGRAFHHGRDRDAFVGAVVAALALPYLGFADMRGQKLVGNTLVAGLACLSLLWLAALRLARSTALRPLRSSVLFVYGGFALAAMAARVVLERSVPPAPSWSSLLLEYSGPFLMAAVLVYATIASRSLLPMIGGLLIVVVLFPELKADFQTLLPTVSWGTGLGSAVTALGFLLLAFLLRERPSLQRLGAGDRFFGGAEFPLRRHDHRLLTTPLVGAVLYLILRVDFYTLVRNWPSAPAKTAVAVVLTAVAWTLLGVWARDRRVGPQAVWLAFVPLYVGLWLGQRSTLAPGAVEWPLLAAGLLLQLAEIAYATLVVPRRPWADGLLLRPTRQVLRVSSALVAAGVATVLALGHSPSSLRLLLLFSLAEVVRWSLEKRSRGEGALAMCVALLAVLAETSPGEGDLLSRLTWSRSLWPVLLFALAWHVAVLVAERRAAWLERLAPLLDPGRTGAALLTSGMGVLALSSTVVEPRFTAAQLVVVAAGLLLLARWALAGPAVLLATLVSYALVLHAAIGAARAPEARLEILADPTRVALLALATALVGLAAHGWPSSRRAWLDSPAAVRSLAMPATPWCFVLATGLASAAALRHAVDPALRARPDEIWASYVAALTLAIVAVARSTSAVAWIAAVALTSGNVHAVRLALGPSLRADGLSDVHLLALGVAVSLAQGALLQRIAAQQRVRDFVRVAALAAAALVLTLLCAHFATDPNLQDITWQRFVVSGALALAAGLFFRRVATRPEPDEAPHVALAYAIYHVGVAMALWCLVLLAPPFREPRYALAGLALPTLYFFAAAERFFRARDARAVQYGRSATVLALAVLGLYAARPLFQLALFPEAAVRTDHYHYNAPLVLLLGFVLLRLGAFETRTWVGYLGGAAVMGGAYFALTAHRALSPFETRFPAAWAGIALGHALVWLSRQGPVVRALQRVGGIDATAWERLVLAWHLTAFVGALDLAFVAIVHPDAARFGTGAVLAGAFSVLLERRWLRAAVSAGVGVLLAVGLVEAIAAPSWLSEVGILLVALVAARAVPAPFALAGSLAVYVLAQHAALSALPGPGERWALVTSPWRLSALSLGLSLLLHATRRRRARAEEWLWWVGGPAALLAVFAVASSTWEGRWQSDPAQLWTGYLAAATHALLALEPAAAGLVWSAAALLTVANGQLLDRTAGPLLRFHGLSDAHLAALALGATLLVVWPVRWLVKNEATRARIAAIRATGAAGIVGLLAGNYVVHPGLAGFGPWRGAASSALALLAAEALRSFARLRPAPGLKRIVTALYHAAVLVAIESATFSVPFFRLPELALVGLALPALYFWARCETTPADDPSAGTYRDAATVTSAAVLLFYAVRTLLAVVLLSGALPPLRHYHLQAPVALALGLVLLRLHARGAPEAVAVLGGLSVLCGSYFAATAGPGLSPFDHPLAGAWAGIILVHLWTLATAPSTAVTGVLRGFAGLDDEQWPRLRATLGQAALLGAHVLALCVFLDPAVDTRAVAPLLVGVASLLLHHGVVRGRGIYVDLAALELLAAAHADLLTPSWLALEDAVWVLLVLRTALLLLESRVPASERARVRAWGAITACIALGHVFSRPWSTRELVAAGVLAFVTALVPRERRAPVSTGERIVVALLLAAPTWLVFFGSGRWDEIGLRAALESEPLLRALLALLLTGVAARTAASWAGWLLTEQGRPRAAHQVALSLSASGEDVHAALLVGTSLGAAALLVGRYGQAYEDAALVLFLILLGGLSFEWYRRGRSRGSWLDCLVGEAALACAVGLVRRQLLLRTNVWTYEYDLWLSLAASAALTGLKQRLDRVEGVQEIKRPVVLSILAMPAFAIAWALLHGLGSDMVLLVVGLNSVLFALLGHERRRSPYNLVAVTGFVAFVLIAFWSKLELRAFHAYTVPVGLGVLLLLQLFQDDVPPRARARVRLVTLVVMLGSAAYHAILDPRHPLAFNLTLLLLCLGCIALGSWLRVVVYVGLGLSVLLLDLVSLTARALGRLDPQARMIWVGVAVFLLGALIVAGAVYRKARREEIDAWLSRRRAELGTWW